MAYRIIMQRITFVELFTAKRKPPPLEVVFYLKGQVGATWAASITEPIYYRE